MWYGQPILAIWFNSESILLTLKPRSEVARLAAVYLKYISLVSGYIVNNISSASIPCELLFFRLSEKCPADAISNLKSVSSTCFHLQHNTLI